MACALVRRNDVVTLDAFTLAPFERHAMRLEARILELTRSGNEGPCEVRPVASGAVGTQPFTVSGRMIVLDSNGQPAPDERELFDEPRCFAGDRCSERK